MSLGSSKATLEGLPTTVTVSSTVPLTINLPNIGNPGDPKPSGLVLENNTPSTSVTHEVPPGVEFLGSYWDGAQSQPLSVLFFCDWNTAKPPSTTNVALWFNGLPAATATFYLLRPTTLATASQNVAPPNLTHVGSFWNGSVGAAEEWEWSPVVGTGANPTSSFQLLHYGTTGVTTLDLTNTNGSGTQYIVKVPTVAPGDNSNSVASTAFVQAALVPAVNAPPEIVSKFRNANVVNSVSANNIFSPTKIGMYRVSISCQCITSGTTAIMIAGVTVNNGASIVHTGPGTNGLATPATAGDCFSRVIQYYAPTGTSADAVGYSTALTNAIGTAVFQVDITIEYLGA